MVIVESAAEVHAYVDELRAENERLKADLAEADAWIFEASKTITGLTAGGSEYFARRVRNVYRADLPFCAQRIRERFESTAERLQKVTRERDMLFAQRPSR